MVKKVTNAGLAVAAIVFGCWLGMLVFLLQWHINWFNPFTYFFVLVQMHLYTGLFITAHDAMHGTVSPNRFLNNFTGYVCTIAYAAFWYPKLHVNHHRHHNHVLTAEDPDYHNGNFFSWFFTFMKNYLSFWQIIIMGCIFMLLQFWLPMANLLLFWIVPSLLSTLQLFYFGTYLPHKGGHENVYRSGSQSRNHVKAFLACYFFGYHYEHHHAPWTPWWLLWKTPPALANNR